MRDPIERAKSAIRYFFETQNKNIDDISTEQLIKVASADFIISMSSYELTIRKLEQHFDSNELLYLFFEDVMKNKQESLNKVTRFLGIADVGISSEQLEKKVNMTSKSFDFPKEIDELLKARLQKTYATLNFRFDRLPESWATID
jgi:Sulfotransferase domain.